MHNEIVTSLGVRANFNAAEEIKRRIAFLGRYLLDHHAAVYVLGINGCIDSTTADRIAQRTVESARNNGEKLNSLQCAYRTAFKQMKPKRNMNVTLFVRTGL